MDKNALIGELQATLQSDFLETAHESVDVPKAPFGDSGLHVAFYKHESVVQLEGEFKIEQLEAVVAELRRRAAR